MILIIKHIEIEGPGSIEEFFRNTNWRLQTVNLAQGERLPNSFKDIEAIITLGGPMNVYEEDKYPFLKDENEFLKNAIKEQVPILGICLGAQLLAKAGGAKVRKAAKEEIGWYKINLTKDGLKDNLFSGLKEKIDVFQWHEDTFDIPKQGVLLANSETCKNQAFRLGSNAYGLQFHFEVTADMIEDWTKEYKRNGEFKGKALEMITLYNKLKTDFEYQANLISLNFSRFIK
ncbi:MAG: type 1 glutamine amidotransferase [Candidatus Omnitrophota bacterium]